MLASAVDSVTYWLRKKRPRDGEDVTSPPPAKRAHTERLGNALMAHLLFCKLRLDKAADFVVRELKHFNHLLQVYPNLANLPPR